MQSKIDRLKKTASSSDMTHKHAAMITIGGKVQSIAYNRNTTPKHPGRKRMRCRGHAEMEAIKQCRLLPQGQKEFEGGSYLCN